MVDYSNMSLQDYLADKGFRLNRKRNYFCNRCGLKVTLNQVTKDCPNCVPRKDFDRLERGKWKR